MRTSAVRYLHAAKRDLIYPSLAMQPPRSPLRASRFMVSATVILLCAFSDASFAQRQTGTILQDAPLVLLPEKTRGPLLIMEKGVTVQVIRREGDWF